MEQKKNSFTQQTRDAGKDEVGRAKPERESPGDEKDENPDSSKEKSGKKNKGGK